MKTRFRIDPKRGLLIINPTLLYPVASDFGSACIASILKEHGRLPRIIELGGEQYLPCTHEFERGIEVDELLQRDVWFE